MVSPEYVNIINRIAPGMGAVGNDVPWFVEKVMTTLTKAAAQKDNRLIVVGITGLAGAGKDTAVAFLEKIGNVFQNYSFNAPGGFAESPSANRIRAYFNGFGFDKLAFASPLKASAMAVGFTYEQCYDPELKNKPDPFWGISPRQFLQMCGTEMFRNVIDNSAYIFKSLVICNFYHHVNECHIHCIGYEVISDTLDIIITVFAAAHR